MPIEQMLEHNRLRMTAGRPVALVKFAEGNNMGLGQKKWLAGLKVRQN